MRFLYSGSMDSEALRTFLSVHRHQGFSRAAQVLHRTQPTVSRRIGQLEHELGARLFDRMAGRVVLSQAGRVLLPYAERVLAAEQDAQNAVRALRSEDGGPLSLAIVGTLAGPPLANILKRFTEDHHAVDLTLRTARSAEVSDLVRLGDATVGVRYHFDPSADLHSEELGSEPLLVVCAANHPLAGRPIESLHTLRAERWFAFPDLPGHREIGASHVFGLFLMYGLGEVDWTPIDSLTAQKRLVEAGFGLALMTESSVADELAAKTISIIPVKDLDAGVPAFIVTRRGGFLSAAASRLRELLQAEYAIKWSRNHAPTRGRRKSDLRIR